MLHRLTVDEGSILEKYLGNFDHHNSESPHVTSPPSLQSPAPTRHMRQGKGLTPETAERLWRTDQRLWAPDQRTFPSRKAPWPARLTLLVCFRPSVRVLYLRREARVRWDLLVCREGKGARCVPRVSPKPPNIRAQAAKRRAQWLRTPASLGKG